MRNDDVSKEKERLMREVLGRPRAYQKGNSKIEIYEPNVDEEETTHTTGDAALLELQRILSGQKKEIEDLSKHSKEANLEMEQFQKELAKDYDLQDSAIEETIDEKEVFLQSLHDVNHEVIGQASGNAALNMAFRRPFVMHTKQDQIMNVILVCGEQGTGRHEAVKTITSSLYKQSVFPNDQIESIDLSFYQSAAQEGVFLQDMYQAIQSQAKVITLENFESSFAPFLRMIDELVINNKIMLNKRYVFKDGVLVENQTGLVQKAVDSLQVKGKYLVFYTSNSLKEVQNAFGSEFMEHVSDIVRYEKLEDETIEQLVKNNCEILKKRCKQQLGIYLEIEDEVVPLFVERVDKNRGLRGVEEVFEASYFAVADYLVKYDCKDITLLNQDGKVCVKIGSIVENLFQQKSKQQEIQEIEEELSQIVGLQEVKDYIHSIQSHIEIQELRNRKGLKISPISYHMIFTGNPGTGKTTIARLISRYMKAIGALSQGQLVEVTRKDLVAQYVGQTAPLTMSVVKSALGGVLFIDEAYSLHRGKEDSFGLECIDTLVKAMEDHRDELIVILAGYEDEMEEFLESNSGLRSRFPNVMHFEDFDEEELLQITILQTKQKGYVLEEDAKKKLLKYYGYVQANFAKEAGNGRLARNLVEGAILQQSNRLLQDHSDDVDLSLLKAEDFVLENNFE